MATDDARQAAEAVEF
jgi:hypothetical protein